MRASRLLILAGIAMAAVALIAGPAGARQKKLHDGTVLTCTIFHDGGIGQDILNIRFGLAEADKKVVSKIDPKNGPVEVAVALLFLTQSSAHPAAVVDGTDSGKIGKKGKGNFDVSFNSFGTYQVNITESRKGFKPSDQSFKFQVTDTNGGTCHMVQ